MELPKREIPDGFRFISFETMLTELKKGDYMKTNREFKTDLINSHGF